VPLRDGAWEKSRGPGDTADYLHGCWRCKLSVALDRSQHTNHSVMAGKLLVGYAEGPSSTRSGFTRGPINTRGHCKTRLAMLASLRRVLSTCQLPRSASCPCNQALPSTPDHPCTQRISGVYQEPRSP
jgi:hypothetical protein